MTIPSAWPQSFDFFGTLLVLEPAVVPPSGKRGRVSRAAGNESSALRHWRNGFRLLPRVLSPRELRRRWNRGPE
jgi:hypothetical protein